MQYMLLLYGDQNGWESLSEQERGQMLQAYGSFTQELGDSGAMVVDNALQPSPVVALNHAVAVTMAQGPEQGLALIDRIDGPPSRRSAFLERRLAEVRSWA